MKKTRLFERDELKKDLKKKSIQGAVIRSITNLSSAIISIVSVILLARLLGPKEIGLFAMVVAISEFARMILELGLGTATVQREKISHNEVSTLFWINFLIGTVLMLFIACLSPFVAWFYNDNRLFNICLVLSIVFLFRGLTVQHRSLLERQMRFGTLGLIYIISNFISVCLAVIMAYKSFGVWALVAREISSAAFYAAGTWFTCGWLPGLPKRNTGVRSSLRFGADLSGVNIVQYFTQNLDKVLIGRFCGATPLGLYAKALQLVMMPISHAQMTFWDVGLSPMSVLQNEIDRYRRFYERLLSTLSFLYIPFLAFLFVQPENVILLTFGEDWLEAVPFVRIFAIAGFVSPILNTIKLVMISCGKTRRFFWWGTINGICLVFAYAGGIRWGAIGVAYAFTFTNFAILIWSFWYCFRDTPISGPIIIKAISLPTLSSALAGAIVAALIPYLNTSVAISTFISGIVLGVFYLGIWLCIPKGRQQILEFWSYRAELFNRN